MLTLSARAISRSLRQGLSAAPLPLHVLAVFEEAYNLLAADGRVFALVGRAIGPGPLNIVLPGRLPGLALPPAGAPAAITAERLRVGGLEVDLRCDDWEPCPDWAGLRGRYHVVAGRAAVLGRRARQLATAPGLLALTAPEDAVTLPGSRVHEIFRQALKELPRGELWPAGQVGKVAARLAGLGEGLTPAGDDWLAGLLAWAWLAHPQPQEVGAAVSAAAEPRSTPLAAAFLRSAARGECDAAWQNLLTALTTEHSNLDAAVCGVLAHGATSGADRLAGFLYPIDDDDGCDVPAPACFTTR